VLPPQTESSKWEIQLFPNPISGDGASLSIKFLGQGYKELKSAKMEIFNIKGQKISSYIADQASLSSGSYTGQIPDLVPGLYFLKVSDQAQGIRTHKFIVK
ncbi:MAG: T9SS type A sorting domain-containing protein, partial [Candidatus Cloacimonetes bacterium]|nr:T9SS type A sorting domain-containing protein [Candidatus Cloacimonadota bacterium]